MSKPDHLAEIEERLARATPGVWKLWGMDVLTSQDGTSDVDTAIPVATTHMLIEGKPRTFDAELIAHAPADLAALLAVVKAVRAMHREIAGPDGSTTCFTCIELDHSEGETPWDYTYPCPTARALEAM